MFDTYSERARRVVLAARMRAGRRGTSNIEVIDMLFAIVMEDDDQKFGAYLQGSFGGGSGALVSFGSHPCFLAPEIASELLAKLEAMVAPGKPISDADDMPVAADAGQTFQKAEELRKEMGHKSVEPLHLLAAILCVPSEIGDLVRRLGITEEMVRQRLREELT